MWQKHCIFPPKTLWIDTNHFVQSLSFDHQTQFFFPSWNIDSIIPLVSITYLVLVLNFNTIKYICFISSWHRAGMHCVGVKIMSTYTHQWIKTGVIWISESIIESRHGSMIIEMDKWIHSDGMLVHPWSKERSITCNEKDVGN
jgi:hypothetical protein